jgi:hypothetical protein
MSWLFSQALVEEYLAGNFSDGEQSAPLSGKPIPQAYCAPDKMTAFSRLSRFGMTFKPLMATHGEALLMSYLAAFPAKTSQPQGGGGRGNYRGQKFNVETHGEDHSRSTTQICVCGKLTKSHF